MGDGFMLVDVDNPMFSADHAESQSNPKKTKAAYNYRESPVSLMHARGQVGSAQAMAANEFRRLYELAGQSGPKAVDWRKEPVDGGGPSDGDALGRQMEAAREIIRAKNKLGDAGFLLVEKICGQCMFLKHVVEDMSPKYNKRHETKLSKELKDCLTTLAIFWGYQRLDVRRHRGW